MHIRGRKHLSEGRPPNRKWRQCREGGRKPGWVWDLDGGKQPCLGLKLPHFWGEYLSLCFSPRDVNLFLEHTLSLL